MKKCLLVIDYQNDFIEGTLGFLGADQLASGIKQLIDSFHQQSHDVIFTMDTHSGDYLDTQEGKKLPVKHCIEETSGHQIYSLVDHVRKEHDAIFYKNTFGSLELANFLHHQDYEEIFIVGLVTNICVISNAILAKAALPEANIIVYRNLVASFDESLHEKSLEVMQSLQMDIQVYER